jgi:hypothetical protein
MADNVTLPGTGTVVATKDSGTAEYQIMLLADGTYAVVSPATAINQATLNSLVETLQELVQRLAPLAGAVTNVGGQSLVVSQKSVPSTAVTGSVTATGGGYITSAQSIGEKTVGGISYTLRVAEENMAAVLSNINNAIMK